MAMMDELQAFFVALTPAHNKETRQKTISRSCALFSSKTMLINIAQALTCQAAIIEYAEKFQKEQSVPISG